MATNLSRRVFLKCAGAAALAVTASGIFAGCSPSGGGSKDTVYGVGESTPYTVWVSPHRSME